MTEPALALATKLVKYVGRILDGSKEIARAITIATISVAEMLLELITSHFVADISRVKESLLQKMEAETAEKKADADRRIAEAAEAANRATLHKRDDAIAKAELEYRCAEAAKTAAEAAAIRLDAETRRIEGIANAQAKLLEAIAKLRSEDGDIYFSRENLETLLRLKLPAEPPGRQDKVKDAE